jgi:hypothetical protein
MNQRYVEVELHNGFIMMHFIIHWDTYHVDVVRNHNMFSRQEVQDMVMAASSEIHDAVQNIDYIPKNGTTLRLTGGMATINEVSQSYVDGLFRHQDISLSYPAPHLENT